MGCLGKVVWDVFVGGLFMLSRCKDAIYLLGSSRLGTRLMFSICLTRVQGDPSGLAAGEALCGFRSRERGLRKTG